MTTSVGAVASPPGRDREVAALESAISGLEAGRGGVVLLSGEGGVGKTTLSAWAAEEARSRGVTVLDAPCFELSIDTPYACLVSAFGPVLRDDVEGAAELAVGLHSLALLFEGVDTGRDAPVTAIADPGLVRSRLHGALATLVSRLSARAPVILAVDDLHWADSVSIEVLHSLVSDLPDVALLIVATLRPFEAAERVETRRLLRTLRAADWTTTVDVGGLDVDATRAIVQRRLGSIYPNRVVELVQERSGGTPLVAEELLELMVETGALRQVGRRWDLTIGDEWPLPSVADDLIGDRLGRLGDASVQLVASVAVAGEPASAALLAAVTGRSVTAVADELEALRRGGVVDRVDTRDGAAWVAHHPIIGEVALSLVGRDQQARIHAAYLSALPDAGADRRGRHLLGAGALARGPEDVAELLWAGRSALDRAAPDEACRLLGAALEAIDGDGVAPELSTDVLWTAGRAWTRRGEFGVSGEHLTRARRIASAAGDLDAEAGVLADLQYATWSGQSDLVDFEAESESLLARLEEAGRWSTAHGLVRGQVMRRARAGEESSLATSLAHFDRIDPHVADDPEAREWSRHLRMLVPMMELRDGPALLAETEERLDATLDLPELHRRVLHERLDLVLALGTRDEIVAAIEDEQALAEEYGDWVSWRVGLAAWDVAMGDGDLDRTSEIEAMVLVVDVDRPFGYTAVTGAVTDVLLGREPRPLPDVVRPAPDPVLEHLLSFCDLWCTSGDAAAEAAIGHWRRRRLLAGVPLLSAVGAAMGHLRLGDHAGFDSVIDVLERFDGGTGRATAWARILVGEAASGAARADAYADAAGRFADLGRPFDEAICWLTAAESGGNVGEAELAGAGPLLAGTGSPWLTGRLDALVGSAAPTSPSGVDDLGLTSREREVADVVALGLSNREIANRLFISVRTVTSHLDHIYTKLGIGSRGELRALIEPGRDPDT